MPHCKRNSLVASLLLLLPALGCATKQRSSRSDGGAATSRVALLPAGGYKGKYNNDEQGHADFCVKLRSATVALRFADGTPTGFTLTTDILVPSPGNGVSCPESGMARLDARELVSSLDDSPMLFHRGGWGFAGNDPESGVHYGHVLLSDIDTTGIRYDRATLIAHVDSSAPASSSPRGRWIAAPTTPWSGKGQEAGNGTPCDSLSTRPYTVRVHTIPADMKYLNSAQTTTIPYAIYGSPATDLGPTADRTRGIHYTMLTWSWINVRGGGVARALVPDGGKFYRCDDVPAIVLASVNETQQKTPTGWVEAVYGAIPASGNHRLYGWIVSAHRHGNDDVVQHLTR